MPTAFDLENELKLGAKDASPAPAEVEPVNDEIFAVGGEPEDVKSIQKKGDFDAGPVAMSPNEKILNSYEKYMEDFRKPRFILREKIVDKFNKKRFRILLTPSMCQRLGCNFDASEAMFNLNWFDVPRPNRRGVIDLLKEHILRIHNHSEDHIIGAEEMPKRWLNRGASF